MQTIQTATLIRDEEDLAVRYSAEIRRLRIIVSKLERERESLATLIGRRRSWTSALRRSLVEILDKIFMEVALDVYGYYSLNIASSEKIYATTLSLSQVCSRWRRITQGLPHLWSTLGVDIYDLKRDIKPLIQLHFRHAQDSILAINLFDSEKNCGFEPEDDPKECLGEVGCTVYRTIMKELHRCGELRIDLQPSTLSIAIHPWFQFNLSFPRLRKFYNGLCDEIDWTDQRVEGPRWFREAFQKRAPMLVHAETMYLTPFTQTMFRCSGLTSLEVSVAPLLDAFVGFLSQCTQLRTLAIEDLEFWESANDLGLHDSFLPPIVPPAVIPSLRSASFETTTPYHLGVLFRSIILPELEDLTIDLTSYQPGPHFPSLRQDQSQFQSFLLDLLSRSSCQLKKLRFAFLDTPTYKSVGIHWPRMFSASPQLTHLHLMASRWISAVPAGASIDFISALAISDHGLPSLPYLGNIEIDGIINALEYNILRMLESRATFRTSDSDSPPLRAKFRFVKPPSNRPPIPGVMELLKGRNILCDSKFAR